MWTLRRVSFWMSERVFPNFYGWQVQEKYAGTWFTSVKSLR